MIVMPWPETPAVPHVRLTWGGTLGGGAQDIWSNGLAFRVSNGLAPTAAELQAFAQATAPNLGDLVSASVFQTSPAVTMRWVKAVWILNTGKQRDSETAIYDLPVPAVGAGDSRIWEQSYCVTLRTNVKRGRGHAGRIYPPINGPSPEGNGPYAALAFVNNAAQAYAAAFRACEVQLSDVMNDPNRTGFLVIHSRGTQENPIPIVTDVQSCVMDRVADIQHRRVNRVLRAEGNTYPI